MFVAMQAAILQRAVDYIADLHRQKAQLVAKNSRLVQLLANGTGNRNIPPDVTSSAITKRRRQESRSSSCYNSQSSDDDVATAGPPRRRKLKVDQQLEADRKLTVDKAEDLRIASLPLSSATLPGSAQAVVPQLSVCIPVHIIVPRVKLF